VTGHHGFQLLPIAPLKQELRQLDHVQSVSLVDHSLIIGVGTQAIFGNLVAGVHQERDA
jgi:hypothetical protein